MSAPTTHAAPPRVTVELLDERIARVAFANPERRHALDATLLDALVAHLDALAVRRPPPVVILSNAAGGDVWSAGHDLRELADDRDPLAYDKPLERALRRVRTYPGVVIAALSGSAWGGAVDLVMSCDLVVAARGASLAMTPANIGLPYSTSGLLRFSDNLPIHVLKEMFFCAQPLDAERAAHFGVVNRLAADGEFEAAALELARTIAAKAPLAVQAVKEQLRVLQDARPLPVDAFERIAELRRHACAAADFDEGLRAFAERRRPQFRGS
ncbi:methylmalonyl-CoA decarboxylase [Burkholderia sp. Ac-20353]|uniref:methylmalonyl-CoA decarboxylase n=1 Tax=Burkholderia sp. Ac-20353 TaxID=2703894 RepID=UPI00197B3254|nr:methylmalonyl-CoA decarboxylase [Burkholderia sp. Ac-20353]MBN3788987.1 methylmalonyl-CoA decarboxylase [Burkholderia sp. Ac-20353]